MFPDIPPEPKRTESVTIIFLIIRPFATRFPLADISPGIVPIVRALIALVLVKYKLEVDSITSDVDIT
jgi:hypothetical protein